MPSTHRARRLPFAPSCVFLPALAVTLLAVRLAAQAPQWRPFSSAADTFRVLFPGEPQVSRNSVPVGSDTFELRSYEATAGSSSLYIGVCDYGPKGAAADPAAMLSSAKKGAVQHMSAHILSEKSIALGSSPGVAFQAENDKLHFTVRMYMAGSVLYQTMVATPLGDQFPGAARFLDSFELLPSAQPASAPAPEQPANWKQYRFAADGFSVWFPAPATLRKQSLNADAGPVELRTYTVDQSSATLIAAVCDYGADAAGKDPEAVLEHARQGAVESIKGRLTREKKITLGNYPGLDFEADSDTAHVSVRAYLVGATLYQMIVASPIKAPSPDAPRFLDSFELLPRATR